MIAGSPPPARANSARAILALASALALVLSGCSQKYNLSSLVISAIVDPNGGTPTLQLAVSRQPDFIGGFKTVTASYQVGSGGSPAVSFTDIAWEGDSDDRPGEFWLLVAQDSNDDNRISDGDSILPAMRFILRPGETTTIGRIVFDTNAGNHHIISPATFSWNHYAMPVFISDPSQVGPSNMLYLRLGTAADLSATFSFDLPIASPELTSGLGFVTADTHALVWLDADGSQTLNTGDWVSDIPSAAQTLVALTRFVLWPGRIAP